MSGTLNSLLYGSPANGLQSGYYIDPVTGLMMPYDGTTTGVGASGETQPLIPTQAAQAPSTGVQADFQAAQARRAQFQQQMQQNAGQPGMSVGPAALSFDPTGVGSQPTQADAVRQSYQNQVPVPQQQGAGPGTDPSQFAQLDYVGANGLQPNLMQTGDPADPTQQAGPQAPPQAPPQASPQAPPQAPQGGMGGFPTGVVPDNGAPQPRRILPWTSKYTTTRPPADAQFPPGQTGDEPAPAQDGPQGPGATQTGAPPAAAPGDQQAQQADAPWQFDTVRSMLQRGENPSGDPNAKNPRSSASGLYQFTGDRDHPGTWQQFMQSDAGRGYTLADKNKPEAQEAALQWLTKANATVLQAGLGRPPSNAEVASAHMLGAAGFMALAQHPDASVKNLLSADAIKNNPMLSPGQTGAQALAAVKNYYASGASGGSSSVAGGSTPPQGADVTPAGYQQRLDNTPQGGLPGMGNPNFGQGSNGLSPISEQDKWLAIAAGLFGGHNLGDGLSAGLTNYLKLKTDWNKNQLDRDKLSQTLGTRVLTTGMNNGTRLATTGMNNDTRVQTTGMNNDTSRANTGDRITSAQTIAGGNQDLRRQALELQQQRYELAAKNSNDITSGLRTVNQATAKASATESDQILNEQKLAGNDLQNIGDIRELVAKEGITGNTVKQRIARFAADNLGVDIGVSPSGYSLSNKLISDFNSGAVLSNAKGTISRLTQGEFNTLKTGILSMQTNPQAALAMLDTYEQAAKRRMAVSQAWQHQLTDDPSGAQRTMLQPGGLGGWYSQQVGGQLAARGINSNPATPTPSQYQPAAGGGWQHVDVPGFGQAQIRINGVTPQQQ